MTDGILLKEIEQDRLLKKYSVIVVDEAHERSLNSDILVSLLTRIAHARCVLSHEERTKNMSATSYQYFPLRVIIMSATLRVEDFKNNKRLFNPNGGLPFPKAVTIATRQYPVTIHYNKITKEDYAEQAFKKATKIHT